MNHLLTTVSEKTERKIVSKILLYIDEDAQDEDFVQALRSRNVDVITVTDANMLHRDDDAQLEWATAHNRVSIRSISEIFISYTQFDLSSLNPMLGLYSLPSNDMASVSK